MKKIAIIADHGGSIAVWNAMKIQLDLIIEAGYNIIIFANEKSNNTIIQNNYLNKVIYYNSKKELKNYILNQGDFNYIWCPNIFSIITISHFNLPKDTKVVFWVQGSIPDESYLRHKSILRKYILLLIEKYAFYKTDIFIFVSDYMCEFYRHRHRLANKKYGIIPCISEINTSVTSKIPKIKDSYVYIGGLSKWQCFDEILEIYEKIQTETSIFHVITLEIENAKKKILNTSINPERIKVYSVKNREDIPIKLSQYEYGFLIREDNAVNNVASPIKFCEYLSCNVNVIMTNAVRSYNQIINKYKIGTIIELKGQYKINKYNNNASGIYDKLFNRHKFVDIYRKLLG